jgi:hypothetical protein
MISLPDIPPLLFLRLIKQLLHLPEALEHLSNYNKYNSTKFKLSSLFHSYRFRNYMSQLEFFKEMFA